MYWAGPRAGRAVFEFVFRAVVSPFVRAPKADGRGPVGCVGELLRTLRPLTRLPRHRHRADGAVGLRHRPRVRLPVPVLLPLPHRPQGGRPSRRRRIRPLELPGRLDVFAGNVEARRQDDGLRVALALGVLRGGGDVAVAVSLVRLLGRRGVSLEEHASHGRLLPGLFLQIDAAVPPGLCAVDAGPFRRRDARPRLLGGSVGASPENTRRLSHEGAPPRRPSE
mmetsp:Transcript_30607/g.93553  ORF Transcript_30607/g.93553 Transcript_30607/m.93553 type:complete len:223 (+) Transcript_30607:274-942(+)